MDTSIRFKEMRAMVVRAQLSSLSEEVAVAEAPFETRRTENHNWNCKGTIWHLSFNRRNMAPELWYLIGTGAAPGS
jgi:hypothetical protein